MSEFRIHDRAMIKYYLLALLIPTRGDIRKDGFAVKITDVIGDECWYAWSSDPEEHKSLRFSEELELISRKQKRKE